jgi:hypothetical protein
MNAGILIHPSDPGQDGSDLELVDDRVEEFL